MPARNTLLRYGSVAMALHWIIAAFLLLNICLGLYMVGLSRDDPMKFAIIQVHKSIGLTILVLSLLRVLWRLVNPVPPLPRDMNRPLRFLAHASHFLLYVLILALPLSGWLMVSASPLGLATPYFGLFDWPNLPFFAGLSRAALHSWRTLFSSTHVFLAWSAIVLVPIHVIGALYHQIWRGDAVLRRMLPGTRMPS